MVENSNKAAMKASQLSSAASKSSSANEIASEKKSQPAEINENQPSQKSANYKKVEKKDPAKIPLTGFPRQGNSSYTPSFRLSPLKKADQFSLIRKTDRTNVKE